MYRSSRPTPDAPVAGQALSPVGGCRHGVKECHHCQCRGGVPDAITSPKLRKKAFLCLTGSKHHRPPDPFDSAHLRLPREMQSQAISSKAALVPSSLRQSPFTTQRPAARVAQVQCSSSFRERAGKVAAAVALSLTLATGGEAAGEDSRCGSASAIVMRTSCSSQLPWSSPQQCVSSRPPQAPLLGWRASTSRSCCRRESSPLSSMWLGS